MFEQKSKELKRKILDIGYRTGKGHLGGTFSVLDILVALYYSDVLKFDYRDLKWGGRDIVLVGKGHACLATYCILADKGSLSEMVLDEFGVNGGFLGTQFDIRFAGAECNTGSLGHVVGIGAGYALAFHLLKNDRRVFVIVGDGECEEGAVWESIAFAVERKLGNLVVIVDNNGLTVTSTTKSIDFCSRFSGFGAQCMRIDGHDFNDIARGLDYACRSTDRPTVLVADTVKGKGVSFMENNAKWHQSVMSAEEYEIAKWELR